MVPVPSVPAFLSCIPVDVCGILPQNKFCPEPKKKISSADQADFGSNFIFVDPTETLVQHGFHKSGLRKIWLSKNLDIKILRTKGLERNDSASRTVTASTMMADLNWGGKVRCHKWAVEKVLATR
jgi:hypothetical protein